MNAERSAVRCATGFACRGGVAVARTRVDGVGSGVLDGGGSGSWQALTVVAIAPVVRSRQLGWGLVCAPGSESGVGRCEG